AAADAEARRDALWQLGMEAFVARRFADAARRFEAYAEGSQAPLVAGRGFYWAGRAHQEGGRKAAALRAYERARGFDPLHWYALWATRRLLELEPTTTAEPALRAPTAGAAPAAPAIPAVAAFYLTLGLRADAVAYVRADERGSVAERVALRRAVGDVEGAYRLAAQQGARLGERPEQGARWAWEAAYPRPFEDHVRRQASHHGVPWEHVYATMRQESAFDPDAVSGADAIGLLQVLPSSGERVARSLGLPFERDRLFDPVWNVRLGVAEMAALWRRYDGVLPLVIAAYNAGSARVDRWVREETRGGPVALDLFVERIPFDETRGYVRRVVSHFARYRYLASPAAALDVPLPEALPAARPPSSIASPSR
ncbi:MAG: lytic transglycosylase domain-containing protein, partial [Myxococcales bacterium]|nr:lytic transglycosylase domain-containing protein [Myxococcales bacterium]